MNNKFEEMMETMMEKMMMQTMEKMFAQMMGTTVANAVVETPTVEKKINTLSREDFLALSEEIEDAKNLDELDFIVFGSRTARYNQSVPSDIWTINHIHISQKYGAKWSKKNNGYVFETPAKLRSFLQSYQIQTTLDETDRHNIKVYKAERAKARAEYYANLANNK